MSAVATQTALQSKKATTEPSDVDHPGMGLVSPVTGLVSPAMDLVSHASLVSPVSLVSESNANPGNGRSLVSGGTRRSSESPGTTVEVAEVLN